MAKASCFHCGQPIKIMSATAFICTACGVAEFADAEVIEQLQQQQQAQDNTKKE